MRAYLLREGDRTRVVTPYVPEFVNDLKAEIPYYAKEFDRDSKHWIVDGDYEETVAEVASRYFETTVVVTEAEALRRERTARAATAPPRPSHDAQQCLGEVKRLWSEEAELHLLPDAPWDVVQSAYRALAKLRHPDLAGSTGHEAMVRLNRAYEMLTKRRRGATA